MRFVDLVALALAGSFAGNLVRVPLSELSGKSAPLLIGDLLVLFAVAAGLALVIVRGRWRIDRAGLSGLAFVAIGFIAALRTAVTYNLAPAELAFSLAYLARWTAYFALYLLAGELIDARGSRRLARVLEIGLLLFAAFGIAQSLFLPGFAQLIYPDSVRYADWGPQGHRLVSTVLDPNFAGAFIVVGVLMYAGRIAMGDRPPSWRPLLLIAALVLTVSRSSFLALIAGVAFVVLVRGVPWRAVKLAAIAALVSIPFIPAMIGFAAEYGKLTLDASALARFVAWSRAFAVWGDHPVLGVGFNTYGFVQGEYGWRVTGASTFGLDGGLIFIGVLTGIVGLVIFSALLWGVASRAPRVARRTELDVRSRGIALGAAASVPAIVVHSLFVNSLLLPQLLLPLWVLWALPRAMLRPVSASDTLAPAPVLATTV